MPQLNLRTAAATLCLLAATFNLSSSALAHPGGQDGGDCMQPPFGAPDGGPGMPMAPPGMHRGHGFGPSGPGPGPAGFGAGLAGPLAPPWMGRLQLSETQQDAVFNILHAQEPVLRERFKAVHASRKALHRASLTPGADPAQLQTLASAAGKADSELAVLMAQTDQQLLKLLSAEQQRELQACLPN